MANPTGKRLKVQEIADILQVGYDTARRWVANGIIHSTKAGNRHLVYESDIDYFFEQGHVGGNEQSQTYEMEKKQLNDEVAEALSDMDMDDVALKMVRQIQLN